MVGATPGVAVHSGSGAPLLEREHELARIEELVDAARDGTGGLLLIAGPAGIGKTSLLGQCGSAAVNREMVVLRARGDEVAMESSFAVARELLWPEVERDRAGALSGAARLAEPVFEASGEGAIDAERTASVLHGLHWLVANLAERSPLVLLVDDGHWLDPASARFLVYLSRRLDSLAVLLAVAVRSGEAPDRSGLAALSEIAAERLAPGVLSEHASTVILRHELGPRADEKLCRSCYEAVAGNPFYLHALLAALRAEGRRPSVEVAARLRALGAGAVGRSVLVRLARLGPDCERLAEAVAVLAASSPLRHAASLAGLERAAAQSAADSLCQADLLLIDPGLTSPTRSCARRSPPSSRRQARRGFISWPRGCSLPRARRPTGWRRTCSRPSRSVSSGWSMRCGARLAGRSPRARPRLRCPTCAGSGRAARARGAGGSARRAGQRRGADPGRD